MYDEDNVFAKIISGKISSEKVYEDDKVLAINDIRPVAPIHVLVIPKGKYIDYADFVTNASNEDLVYYFTKINEIAHSLGLNNAYRLVINRGVESGQSVFHFHTHIIGGKDISNLI